MAAAELDGRPVIISGSSDQTIRVWNLATGTPVGAPITGHTQAVNAVAVAELDAQPVIISGSSDQTIRVWDLATGTPIGDPITGHDRWVNAVTTAESGWPARDHLRQQRPDDTGVGSGHRDPDR